MRHPRWSDGKVLGPTHERADYLACLQTSHPPYKRLYVRSGEKDAVMEGCCPSEVLGAVLNVIWEFVRMGNLVCECGKHCAVKV